MHYDTTRSYWGNVKIFAFDCAGTSLFIGAIFFVFLAIVIVLAFIFNPSPFKVSFFEAIGNIFLVSLAFAGIIFLKKFVFGLLGLTAMAAATATGNPSAQQNIQPAIHIEKKPENKSISETQFFRRK